MFKQPTRVPIMTLDEESKQPSYWNYRIVKYKKDEGYGLHEVYYNYKGEPEARTERPIIACDNDEGPEGIIAALKMALDSVESRTILNETEIGKK